MTEQITNQQMDNDGGKAQQGLTGGTLGGAEKKPTISWAALLQEAISKPGCIHEAYSRFHSYSVGNQILALFQCKTRSIPPGPLATYSKWKELGRHVKRGEQAIILCMPLTSKRSKTVRKDDGSEQKEEFTFTGFSFRSNWFVLSQTEGAEYQPPAIPEWNEEKALAALKIERVPFEDLDGNTQGYAKRGRKIAISPIAALPRKTFFHEVGHVILGHTDEGDLADAERTPRDIREMEAEAVSLLCCESLGLPGAEYSRGYISSWGQGQGFSERSAQRIFHAADQILRAGRNPEPTNVNITNG